MRYDQPRLRTYRPAIVGGDAEMQENWLGDWVMLVDAEDAIADMQREHASAIDAADDQVTTLEREVDRLERYVEKLESQLGLRDEQIAELEAELREALERADEA